MNIINSNPSQSNQHCNENQEYLISNHQEKLEKMKKIYFINHHQQNQTFSSETDLMH